MHKRRRRSVILPEVTLTPLIDTALTLLIIFMVTTPIIQTSIKVKLPEVKSRTEKAMAKQNLVVFIDENEKVFINGNIVEKADLAKNVEEALVTSDDKVVFVNGDRSVKYDSIVKVLDTINSIKGEKYVALAAKKVEK